MGKKSKSIFTIANITKSAVTELANKETKYFKKFTSCTIKTNVLNVPDFRINHCRGFSYSKALRNFIDRLFFMIKTM